MDVFGTDIVAKKVKAHLKLIKVSGNQNYDVMLKETKKT